jgi:hypothetical protein
MKDFKTSLIYQFCLLITGICPLLAPWDPSPLNFNACHNWVQVDHKFAWSFHSLYNGQPYAFHHKNLEKFEAFQRKNWWNKNDQWHFISLRQLSTRSALEVRHQVLETGTEWACDWFIFFSDKAYSISVLIKLQRVLNRLVCRCEEKM